VSSFGADQFDENNEGEMKKKTSFFNWFYFSINVGALFSSTVLVYIQDNVSWGWGFGVPAVAMGVAIVFFFIGTPLYRHQKPVGSPLTSIAQVLVAAVRKWRVRVPQEASQFHEVADRSTIKYRRKLAHTPAFR
jgi:peptide/histidine transporter 3/4